jgi:hypothetical protein
MAHDCFLGFPENEGVKTSIRPRADGGKNAARRCP